jgi:hypothetical protein
MLMMLALMLVWAQRGGGGGGAGAGAFGGLACMCGALLLGLLIGLIPIAGVWKAFEKAGEPGWTAIVPIYNMMIMSKIAGRGENYGLMCLIPCAGVIFSIIILLDFCKKFDVGGGFVAGLILLPYIFWPILGFGSARYIGGSRAGRRRAVEDEEEDDYDDRPRRPRRRDDDDDEPEERIRRPRRDDY